MSLGCLNAAIVQANCIFKLREVNSYSLLYDRVHCRYCSSITGISPTKVQPRIMLKETRRINWFYVSKNEIDTSDLCIYFFPAGVVILLICSSVTRTMFLWSNRRSDRMNSTNYASDGRQKRSLGLENAKRTGDTNENHDILE